MSKKQDPSIKENKTTLTLQQFQFNLDNYLQTFFNFESCDVIMKNYIAEILKGNRGNITKDIFYLSKRLYINKSFLFLKFREAFYDNAILVYICLLYYISTYIIGWYLGVKITGKIDFYYIIFYEFLFSFFFLMWSATTVLYLIKNFKMGFSGIPIIWEELRNHYLRVETIFRFFIIFTIIPIFMCSYSSIKQTIPLFKYFSFDATLFNLDKFIHFGHLPSDIIQPLVGFPKITLFIDFCYLAWGSLFIYSLLYMACHNNRRLRMQFFISLACCWIFIGNILAIMLSSAGPCYFSEVTNAPVNPYAQLFGYLHSIPGIRAVGIQSSIWNAFQAGIFMPLGGISAMPSMHVSVATLLALLYRNLGRWQGWILTGFALIIQVGSIHLGWHYAVDGYLSAIVTVVTWKIVGNRLKRKACMMRK